jgi:hypothetical protein
MVEKELMDIFQIFSGVATATGVCFAAYYYIITLKNNQRALRINMTNNLLQFHTSVEGQKIWMELLNMKWSSYDDFEKKYGSDNNIDNFAKRQSTWNLYNILGKQLKAGILDGETIYNVSASGPIWTWAKFKLILEENKRRYTGKGSWDGFEYLVNEMMRMRLEKDPEYRVPENFAAYVPDT